MKLKSDGKQITLTKCVYTGNWIARQGSKVVMASNVQDALKELINKRVG